MVEYREGLERGTRNEAKEKAKAKDDVKATRKFLGEAMDEKWLVKITTRYSVYLGRVITITPTYIILKFQANPNTKKIIKTSEIVDMEALINIG